MQGLTSSVEIYWSVWDANPVVAWLWNGQLVQVILQTPPVGVSVLGRHNLLAVVGNYDEQGSTNLRTYSYDGALQNTYTAPALGSDAQFGGVQENDIGVQVIVGFRDGSGWRELAGQLRLDDGVVEGLHRSY